MVAHLPESVRQQCAVALVDADVAGEVAALRRNLLEKTWRVDIAQRTPRTGHSSGDGNRVRGLLRHQHIAQPLARQGQGLGELVGEATKQCYGVAAMAPRDMTDAVKSMVYGSDYPEKGVRVTQQNGRLVIELHIAVSYGLNISTAARSISHRVKDEVEQATGLKVARVVVSVDDVIA